MSKPITRAILALAVALAAANAHASPAVGAEREKRAAITISANDQFDADHGVRSGRGTPADPYVISGWQLPSLRIENTDRHVVIRDNAITNTLVLNWNGDRVRVTNNEVGDLRVNQNVRRTGQPTSGLIAHNAFGVVGQLRHFDGVFERNVVGRKNNLGRRAANFDGFNGASFRDNVVYGYMDARLHGHHHGSDFEGHSHHHAASGHGVDHTSRYHRVSISGNAITTSAPYALAYLDTNHAANDRKAASEQEEALTLPHVHHTRVEIAGNRLEGAGLLVNVFNAQDNAKHERFARGQVVLRGNRITLAADGFWALRDLHGIEVREARHLDLLVEANRIAGTPAEEGMFESFDGDRTSGIYLRVLDHADVTISDNAVARRMFGVLAERFTDDVRWVIRDLRTSDVDERVAADDSVKDSPAS